MFSGVDARILELELSKPSGDRVGVFVEMQNRSRRLRAPLVGVSIETGEEWDRIGFCGVSGAFFRLFEGRWGSGLRGLSIIAAGKSAETASLTSSVGATFLFLVFSDVVAAIALKPPVFSTITLAEKLPFETLVKASRPRDLGKDESLLGAADSFRRLVAVGMVKGYNCCGNYVRSF